MATFVLIHGACCGGWCWKYVTALLRAQNHMVFTPTLTGVGERVHLARPDTGLETHIQDVVGVLAYEELQDVVLVGHSMGGTVITGVADRAADHIAQLVYLDAEIPYDGQCDADAVGPKGRAWVESLLAAGRTSIAPPVIEQRFGITNEADARWLNSKMTPQPIRTFLDPLRLTNPAYRINVRTFIRCTMGDSPASSLERVQNERGWGFYDLPTGHAAMVSAPQELVDILLALI